MADASGHGFMTRDTADDRLKRLLTMVPWVSSQDGPTVEEVCDRYGYTQADLATDLELLFLCGLYPFTPDTLIEADIVDERVWIRYADMLGAVRLTPPEALTLMAAASAVLAMAGYENDQLLSSALAKLAASLGLDHEEIVGVELNTGSPEVLRLAEQAVSEHRSFELDYYSYGRDAWNRRKLEPYRLFSSSGHWYLWARAPERNEVRLFRIDRMRNVALLDECFVPPDVVPDARVYEPRPDDPAIVLDLTPGAAWAAEYYPAESVEALPGGHTRMRLRISERAWVERLLLRLGPDATIIEGDIDISDTARRMLRRYVSEPLATTAMRGSP